MASMSSFEQTLIKDHRTVDSLYTQLKAASNNDARHQLSSQIIKELAVHSHVEELVVYPEYERSMTKGKEASHHSQDEHQQLTNQLYELDNMKADDKDFMTKWEAAIQSFHTHIKEEEETYFPSLKASITPQRNQELISEIEAKRKIVPTHPHPMAPKSYPMNMANAVVTPIDKLRDVMSK